MLQALLRITVVFLLLLPARAEEPALVSVGDLWQWVKGTSEPSEPAEQWRQVEYDDSAWLRGRSGFGMGHGGFNGATLIPSPSTNFVSVYFRRHFLVSHPAGVQWLTLRIHYDDGFVAYLNGEEVARRNLEGEVGRTIPFDQLAVGAVLSGPEEIDISGAAHLLREGKNVLAIQVHRRARTDSTLAMSAELRANFIRGPIIQSTSTTHVQVAWNTFQPLDSMVEFGRAGTLLTGKVESASLVTKHVLKLDSLEPGQRYEYRISSGAGQKRAYSSVAWFETFPLEGGGHFAVLGDSGLGGEMQLAVAGQMAKLNPDFVLHAGDVIYPSFQFQWADLRCVSVYGKQMRNVPYFFAMGNHDLYSGEAPYLQTFYLPTNSVTGTEHYYSFDRGDIHVAVLFVPYLYQHKPVPGDRQHKWLIEDLKNSTKPWKFILLHHPLNTSGLHRNDDTDRNGVPDRIEVANFILPIASEFGVQVVFSGHDHNYERFKPTNGVHFVVTGGGGVYLYHLLQRDLASAQFYLRYHFVSAKVEGDLLTLDAVSPQGIRFDSMSIQRTVPERVRYLSAWHTPVVESVGNGNADGNLIGQAFDFLGEAIPIVHGQFSNLGLARVNNDEKNLYLGIERVMIGPADDLFLFLEVPRLEGVTAMKGVGNGVSDPEGQGVDGLDFLENITFTNFRPSVGLVLGDERADGQFRGFRRVHAQWAAGQGAFYLDSDLGDVPGVRIQQYNRSPEGEGALGDDNADFVEIALPLSALGRLRPGELIRVAAVVGGSQFDLASQTRQIDSGFLGRSLTNDVPSGYRVEPIEVLLSENPAGEPPFLRLRVSRINEDEVRVEWRGPASGNYVVEMADSLLGTFEPAESLQAQVDVNDPELFYFHAENGQRTAYFRVRKQE